MTLDVRSPKTIDEVVDFVGAAYRERTRMRLVGAGTSMDLGHPVEADVLLSLERLDAIVEWEPQDLTAVVQAGTSVSALEERLGGQGQSAMLPEWGDLSTVGGTIAAGRSGWRRLRYGPTRDRVLEVTMVTGEGRLVTAGGRLVKNVTGYDIPRLATGAFGALGVIVQVCLKLWPLGEASATVTTDLSRAGASYRPLAVLETNDGTSVYLSGTEGEVAAEVASLDGDSTDGLQWPDRPTGDIVVSVRVPPAALAGTIERFEPQWRFVAQHRVGEVVFSVPNDDVALLTELRAHAERLEGSLVIESASAAVRTEIDPWGTPPPSLDLQRRIVAEFDPGRLINPGILPGRL